MTFVGKLFVMVNLAFSVMMAGAALGLYTTGLDYGPETKKDTTPKEPARITALRTQINDAISTIPAVQGSWRTSRAQLLRDEEQRTKNRQFYDVQLALLRRPPPATVRTVVLGADLLPLLDPVTKLPRMDETVDRAGQPLLPMATYNAQLEALRKENEDVLARLNKQVQEDERLTTLLTGEKGTRGLRQMLVDERIKREGVVAEHNSVRPLFINIAVESQLVRKRLEALQVQIEQLKNYLRKMHKLDVAMQRR
jgi:hypothetical protein